MAVSAVALHFAVPSGADNPVQQASLFQASGQTSMQQVRQPGSDGRQAVVINPGGIIVEQLPPRQAAAASGSEASALDEAENASSSLPVPPDAPVACGEEGGSPVFCIYTVQAGDTLSGIAEQMGVGASVTFAGGELVALSNGLTVTEAFSIQPGQDLRVPLGTGIVHIVDSDDAVSNLAPQYGVTETAIIEANSISDPAALLAGSALLIPAPTTAPVFQALAEAQAAAEAEAAEAAEAEADEEATEDAAEAEETPSPPPEEDTPEASALLAEETPEATATQAATATPRPLEVPERGANPARDAIADAFSEGFLAAGGSETHLRNILYRVIPCESGYRVDAQNPAGPYLGLMQFLPQTWEIAGGGDWQDPRQQGANTARLIQERTPQSQWPHCW